MQVARTAELLDPVREREKRERTIDEGMNLAARQDKVGPKQGQSKAKQGHPPSLPFPS